MTVPFAVTLPVGSSLTNKTGGWRVERPVYRDLVPPCNDACPAGEDIQGWLYSAEAGDYLSAWRRLVQENPMPAVTGRVCFHPCETVCNRVQLDEAVGIRAVERFLGDFALEHGWELPAPDSTGAGSPRAGRVLVVGSGPCGLSAAYHLRRLGRDVTVVEASEELGGMMRYGIPAYRLPRSVLDGEIDRIVAAGVSFETGRRVDDVLATKEDGGYDAVLVAIGAPIARRAYIPAGDSSRILDALSYLRRSESGMAPSLGRRVAVYGGGDTAFDAARTARRLGAEEAVVVYRRTPERMPAHAEEYEQAVAEGVRVRWLSTIANVDGGELVIEKMALDESGFPQPTGEFEVLAADSVILALGEDTDLTAVEGVPGVATEGGSIEVSPSLMTGHQGIFAGGDVVAGERSVTKAIGNGKKAARRIDLWLRTGEANDGSGVARHPVAEFSSLNSWYYSDAPRTLQKELSAARRSTTFAEVVAGLDESTALFEARRCLSCGNCFECDNCYGMCPDNAVTKHDRAPEGDRAGISGTSPGDLGWQRVRPRLYEFDYDYCKGCGICMEECPCGAIVMEPEEI